MSIPPSYTTTLSVNISSIRVQFKKEACNFDRRDHNTSFVRWTCTSIGNVNNMYH
jgi:hypothetical protein